MIHSTGACGYIPIGIHYLMQKLKTLPKKYKMESFLFEGVRMHASMLFYAYQIETFSSNDSG